MSDTVTEDDNVTVETAKVRVLLVAMNRITQAGYHVLEESDPGIHIASIVDTAAGAIAALAASRFDVVVVDLTDERLKGTELIQDIVAINPDVRILAVSTQEDQIQAEIVLQGGAGGYVCRSAPLAEIVKAVHLVAAGQNYLDPSLAQRIALQKLMGKSSNLRVLSPREYEVFCMMAAGAPLREIAKVLNLNYKTVANYGGTIKTKLKVRSREEMRAIARRAGVVSP